MNIVKMTFTRILFFLLLFAYSSHISSQIQFCTSQKNLGTIQANGDIFKVDYTFKNESTQPVAIARIASSCGCTIPSFDKRPIQAGQSGHILVSLIRQESTASSKNKSRYISPVQPNLSICTSVAKSSPLPT